MEVQAVVKVEPGLATDESPAVAMETEEQPVSSQLVKTEPDETSPDVEMKSVDESDAKPEADSGPESKPETEEESKNLHDKSLDDRAVTDAAPDFVAPSKLVGASIRINLTSQVESGKTLERRESTVSNNSDAESTSATTDENSELDPDCITQTPKEVNAPKPMLADRKLTVLPPQNRGTETSSLCSIM